MVFGSDVAVASIDPREWLYAALARRGGDVGGRLASQGTTFFAEAVHTYTAGAGASQGGRALFAPGRDADLVAWSFDAAAERGVGDAGRARRARLSVIGGEVVMQR